MFKNTMLDFTQLYITTIGGIQQFLFSGSWLTNYNLILVDCQSSVCMYMHKPVCIFCVGIQ